LEEVYSHIVPARKLDYIDTDIYNEMLIEIEVLRKLVNGYMAFLKRSKQGKDEPGYADSIREDPITYDAEEFPN